MNTDCGARVQYAYGETVEVKIEYLALIDEVYIFRDVEEYIPGNVRNVASIRASANLFRNILLLFGLRGLPLKRLISKDLRNKIKVVREEVNDDASHTSIDDEKETQDAILKDLKKYDK